MLWFFDITHGGYNDVIMRTTLTIDDDLANSLKEQARQNNLPFKQVVNETLRRGLFQATPGESRPELDPKYYKRILDEEDIQHYLRVRDDIDAANLRRIEEVVLDQEMIERFHRREQ